MFSNLLVALLVGNLGMVEAFSDSVPWPCLGNQSANVIGNYYNQYKYLLLLLDHVIC